MRKNTKKPAGAFFKTRMDALGVTPLNNKISLENPEAEYPVLKVKTVPIFEEDNKGNIAINFYNLEGEFITYYQS